MNNKIINIITEELNKNHLQFTDKPVVIGGVAMEFYEIRKSGADIDIFNTDKDYQVLAKKYPEKRKDIYGDFGVVNETVVYIGKVK